MLSQSPKRNYPVRIRRKLATGCWSVFRALLLIGLAFLILQPLLIKLSTSFQSVSDIYDSSVFLIPKAFTLDNYKNMLEFLEYGKTFATTILFTGLCAFLQVMSCTMVAYGIARFEFKLRGLILGMAVFTLVVPPQTVLLSLFIEFRYFSPVTLLSMGFWSQGVNLVGTPVPMLLLSCTAVALKNGLYIFLLRQYFKNVPKVIEEAAYIDGCSHMRTFLKIMLPGAAVMMFTIFLFAFVWQWNDYFYTSVLMPGWDILSNKMANAGTMLITREGDPNNLMQKGIYDSVAVIILILPLLVLYLFTQKQFVQSIERSGVVG